MEYAQQRQRLQDIELEKADNKLKSMRKNSKVKDTERRLERKRNFLTQLEKCAIRFKPIGRDRFFRSYYFRDGGGGRVYVEQDTGEPPKKRPRYNAEFKPTKLTYPMDPLSPLSTNEELETQWRCYDTPNDIQELIEFLDDRGVRELALKENLLARQTAINKSLAEALKIAAAEETVIRRSFRSGVKKTGMQGYVNRLVKRR